MSPKSLPTKDPEALSNFVQGRLFFQAYLLGQGKELPEARERFQAAASRDPEFYIAKLYLAVAQNEMRNSDAAILALKDLIDKKRFLPEARLQLAYAHMKRYKQADYEIATAELESAKRDAKREKRKDLLNLIEAFGVFVLAVRGGRGSEPMGQRRAYLDTAIKNGQDLLRESTKENLEIQITTALQFEVHNAIGVAQLWLGRLFPQEEQSQDWWSKSEKSLDTASALRPNSVRPLQNLGLLFMLRGDRAGAVGNHDEAVLLYQKAKTFVERSLQLNALDQYPFYQLAQLAIRLGDWDAASSFVEMGQQQSGAISAEKWKALTSAISDKDVSKILNIN